MGARCRTRLLCRNWGRACLGMLHLLLARMAAATSASEFAESSPLSSMSTSLMPVYTGIRCHTGCYQGSNFAKVQALSITLRISPVSVWAELLAAGRMHRAVGRGTG